ncbi:MAG: septum site-determining protein MinC [Lachnospiraceae bacterium]|nr:septum site-determining protein MinC [Lachnospiraceae bacterium]
MNEVVIKKQKDGLTVILNPDIPFDELFAALGKKFRDSSGFFGSARLVISFEGRELEPEEERLLADAISDNSELTVICTLGNADDERNRHYVKTGLHFPGGEPSGTTRYYKGTVRAGETVEADGDIVVIGDVNPGGEVLSAGNVIILGTLYGTARAGIRGDMSRFVIALEIKPIKVCVGESSLTTFGRKSIFKSRSLPKIIFKRKGEDGLTIEEITPETVEQLTL